MNFEMNLDNSMDDDNELTNEKDQGGIIVPKQTCEHVQSVHLCEELINNSLKNNRCVDCENSNENWLCLSCGEIHCSRYIENHGEEHWLFTLLTDEQNNIGHCLTISLQDLSVWCYPCKSYIKNIRLNPLLQCLESIKFGSPSIDENPSHQNAIDHLIQRRNSTPISLQNPSTMVAVQDHLLLDELKKTNLLPSCDTIKLRAASIDELVCLHSSDYVNMIVSAEKNHVNIRNNQFHLEYNETIFSNARLSAGITIDAVQNVLHSHRNGLILVTSPGHRALRDHGNGTSIYNNIALALNSILIDKIISNRRKTSLALIDSNNHLHLEGATPIEDAICHMINVLTPSSLTDSRIGPISSIIIDKNNNKIQIERVLIIDITSEHGCGLQSIYYESEQVFYLSVHKENHQHRSSYHECGKNNGLGYTMNIPLSSMDNITDKEYLTIINELVMPIAQEFKPELIVICIDFHIEQLTSQGYAWIIEQLSTISDSKLVVVLDGDLSCISSKTSYVQTLLSVLIGKSSVIDNDEWKNNNNINIDVREKIDLVKDKHRQYWSCFQ